MGEKIDTKMKIKNYYYQCSVFNVIPTSFIFINLQFMNS